MTNALTRSATLPAIDGIELVPLNSCPGALRHLEDELEAYVTETTYGVQGWHVDDVGAVRETLLGRLHARRMLLGPALNGRVSWFDVADAHSQDLYELYTLMFNDDTGWLNEDFEELVGESSGLGLCYVPTDAVLDHAWGPSALRILAQHTEHGFVVVGVSGFRGLAKDLTQALVRAAKLEAMGFVRYEDSPFFFLNRAYAMPDLPAHLQLPCCEGQPQHG